MADDEAPLVRGIRHWVGMETCAECGGVVHEADVEKHAAWHVWIASWVSRDKEAGTDDDR